jgi:hypothetical protein
MISITAGSMLFSDKDELSGNHKSILTQKSTKHHEKAMIMGMKWS